MIFNISLTLKISSSWLVGN